MFGVPNEWDVLVRGVVLTITALLWVLLVVRVVGLRSFSKMTAFDFVATIATGSLLATAATATRWPDFVQVGIAVLALMAVQAALAGLRKASGTARDLLGNTPILLMRDGRFLDDAMRSARVAREDVLAKIRGANVGSISAVRAVVLETTGDISVLHGGDPDQALLEGVRGADSVAG
jgi:uncharacterized membrane protein YcaP (DUF421 family)